MSITTFEHLANEVLLDIFDYLRPIDIIHAFGMLNIRLQNLVVKRRMHIDLSTNITFNEFNEYCSDILLNYSSCIYSIRLSNIETCGCMKIFFEKFSPIDFIFPNLLTMAFIEPTENDYKYILNLKHLTSIHVKYRNEFQPTSIFNNEYLETCILSFNDILSINKFRPNANLRRLVLDSFYINDLHTIVQFYPSLQHLTIQRLNVNFQGYLPPFTQPFPTLQTLKINCIYTVRFEYIVYLLPFFPQLIRLTIIAIGLDFLNSEQWIQLLNSLTELRVLVLDIKAVSPTFDDQLSSSFLTGFWQQWRVAVDYSQDNHKFHLYTIPYGRVSFISTMHCLSVTEAPRHAFYSVTDLYLKTNTPMEVQTERIYPNVRALQIYQNAVVPVNSSELFAQLNSMLALHNLIHFELFIPLPPSTFLELIKLTPRLRFFKTDYDVLMTLTDHFENNDVCSQLHSKLDKFIVRHGALVLSDNDRFLEIFSQLKHLQINLNTIDDLRQIVSKFVKNMPQLITLQISLLEQNGIPQWEGIMNNISYEIAKRYIKIWK